MNRKDGESCTKTRHEREKKKLCGSLSVDRLRVKGNERHSPVCYLSSQLCLYAVHKAQSDLQMCFHHSDRAAARHVAADTEY